MTDSAPPPDDSEAPPAAPAKRPKVVPGMPTLERGKLADSRIEGALGDYASLPMYREVMHNPRWLVWPFMLGMAAAAVGLLVALSPHSVVLALLLALALAGGAVILWIFSTLTVQAQPLGVDVGFGPFRRSLRYADIVSAEDIPYDAWRFGGWGWRLGVDGSVAYSVIGRKRAVRMRLSTAEWPRVYVVTVSGPEALIECIERRRDAAHGVMP